MDDFERKIMEEDGLLKTEDPDPANDPDNPKGTPGDDERGKGDPKPDGGESPEEGDPKKEEAPEEDGGESDPPEENGDPGKNNEQPSASDIENATLESLEEIFGERVSREEAKERFQKIADEHRELSDLREQGKLKPDVFADKSVLQYNNFVKETGIKDFNVFSRLSAADADEMSPIDKIATKMIMDKPSLAKNEANLKSYLEKEYKVDDFEEGETNFKLELEADKAWDSIESVKEKLSKEPEFEKPAPPKTKEEVKKEQAEMAESWSPVIGEVAKSLQKIEINTGEKEGESKFSYTPEPEEIKKTQEAAIEFAVNNGLEINDQTKGMLQQFVQNKFWIDHKDKIVASVLDYGRSLTDEEYSRKYTNTTDIKNNDKPPEDKASKKSGSDLAFEQDMADMGVKV